MGVEGGKGAPKPTTHEPSFFFFCAGGHRFFVVVNLSANKARCKRSHLSSGDNLCSLSFKKNKIKASEERMDRSL